MTSSLVGSEMCIRDRPFNFGGRVGNNRLSLHAGKHHVGRPFRRAGSGSVSYTHLTLPTICSV
eukprot:12707539-Prorocentrum_lima.AAC.1